jgi:hypothetical protein
MRPGIFRCYVSLQFVKLEKGNIRCGRPDAHGFRSRSNSSATCSRQGSQMLVGPQPGLSCVASRRELMCGYSTRSDDWDLEVIGGLLISAVGHSSLDTTAFARGAVTNRKHALDPAGQQHT